MRHNRIQRVLYVLYLLFQKDYTKDGLMEELTKAGYEDVNKYLITSYISTLIKNGFPINLTKEGKTNIYHLEKESFKLEFTEDEIEILENIKKIIISQKNIDKIQQIMYLYYKCILVMNNDDYKNILIDFDYYSSVNWGLIKKLKEHCKTKDILLLEYVCPDNPEFEMRIHTDYLAVNEWSDKIYLWGEVFDNGELSFLPVDKIFMIKDVIKKNVPLKLVKNEVRYKISRSLLDNISLDKEEKIIKQTKDFVTIKRNKTNKFYIIQRLLSFCPDLYYISDEEIRNEVIKKLKQLRDNYDE